MTSKGEYLLRQAVRSRYPGCPQLVNQRPEWLINPATNYRLELDIIIPELKKAYEFQPTVLPSKETKQRMDLKKRLCKANGYDLMFVTGRDLPKLLAEGHTHSKSLCNEIKNYAKCCMSLKQAKRMAKQQDFSGNGKYLHFQNQREIAKNAAKIQDKEREFQLEKQKHLEKLKNL